MMQTGRDSRWTERCGVFVITEYTGKKARYEITLALFDQPWKITSFSATRFPQAALKLARGFCESATKQMRTRLDNLMGADK